MEGLWGEVRRGMCDNRKWVGVGFYRGEVSGSLLWMGLVMGSVEN